MESHPSTATRSGGRATTLLINLFIPSRATWQARGAQLKMTTTVSVRRARSTSKWRRCESRSSSPSRLRVRLGQRCATDRQRQTGRNARRTRATSSFAASGAKRDALAFTLPLELRLEAAPGDDKTIAVLRGPMVLAADLGAADQPFEAAAPSARRARTCSQISNPSTHSKRSIGPDTIVRPTALTFSPFYKNYHRRSAVYFRRFTDAEWANEERTFNAEQARQKELAARSVDVMHLGEMQPERDHGLTSEISYPVVYRGRQGRDARTGGFFAFRMKVKPGPLILQATYWADERARKFHILVEGQRIATQALRPDKPVFFDVDYEIPEALTSRQAERAGALRARARQHRRPGVRLSHLHQERQHHGSIDLIDTCRCADDLSAPAAAATTLRSCRAGSHSDRAAC